MEAPDASNFSSDRVTTFVVNSLSDPAHPKYCCKLYIAFLLVVLDYRKIEDVGKLGPRKVFANRADLEPKNLRLSHHSLYNTVTAFLVAKRSREEMRILAQEMPECKCDFTADPIVRLLHSWNWDNPMKYQDSSDNRTLSMCDDSLRSLIMGMSDLVRDAIGHDFSDIKGIKKAKKAEQRGKVLQWPATPQEVLGDDDAVEMKATMICRWLDEFPSIPLVRLIQSLAVVSGRKAVFAFLHSAHLPKNYVEILEWAVDRFLTRDMADKAAWAISMCFQSMAAVGSQPDGVSIAYFYGEYSDRLLEVFTKIAGLSEPNRSQLVRLNPSLMETVHWSEMISGTGGAIHSKWQLPHDPNKYHPMILFGSQMVAQARLKNPDPWVEGFKYIGMLIKLDRCSYPLCAENFTSKGRKFKYCSGCLRVPYCSVECQRSDWKLPDRPHKGFCKDLKFISDKLKFPPPTTSVANFPQFSSPTDLKVKCTRVGIDRELIERLSNYMMDEDRVMKKFYAGSENGTSYTIRLE